MPQLFRFGPYFVYFWSNEGRPIEHGTKIWITSKGKALVANNNANIPNTMLSKLRALVESNSTRVIQAWENRFHEVTFYC